MKSGTKVSPIRGKIRELYLEQGMSQKEFVAKANVHRKALYEAEEGEPVLLRHLVRIAKALNLPNHGMLISGNAGGGPMQNIPDKGTSLDLRADAATGLVRGHNIDADFVQGGLPLPSLEQMATLGRHLKGIWREWHWTKDRNDQPQLIKARWEIDDQGCCSVFHEKSKLTFKGVVHFEGKNRLVFLLDAQEQTSERVCCRCKRPKGEDSGDVEAAWFGLDYDEELRCDRLLLTRDMDMSEPQAISKLAGMKDFMAHRATVPAGPITVVSKWNDNDLGEAIIACTDCPCITAMSTYFTADTMLDSAIRQAVEQRTARERLVVRILLMEYLAGGPLAARKLHRKEALTYFTTQIRNQVGRFLDLSRDLHGIADVQVKLYSACPFGTAFQLGERAIYWGLNMSAASAADGPMFVVNDPASPVWKLIQDDLEAVWTKARPAEDEDRPEPS